MGYLHIRKCHEILLTHLRLISILWAAQTSMPKGVQIIFFKKHVRFFFLKQSADLKTNKQKSPRTQKPNTPQRQICVFFKPNLYQEDKLCMTGKEIL